MLTARIDDLYEGYEADADGPDDRGLEDDDEIVEGIVSEEVLEEESSSEWLYAIKSADLTGFSIIFFSEHFLLNYNINYKIWSF